jgi:hypothetical protein
VDELPDLDALLAKWQPRLGLMHWRVKIRWVKSGEMDDAGSHAEVQYNSKSLRSDILVQYPDDYAAQTGCFHHDDKNIESSVVHELLHLVLSPVCEWLDDNATPDMERAVVTLERALCEER